jgi:hypothetical protein
LMDELIETNRQLYPAPRQGRKEKGGTARQRGCLGENAISEKRAKIASLSPRTFDLLAFVGL